MSGIQRLLSKREKRGDSPSTKKRISMYLSPSTNNSTSTANRSTESIDPNCVAEFHGLFSDTTKSTSSEDSKVKSLRQRIIVSKSVMVKEENILWALRCNFSKGDADLAYDLLSAMTDASQGIIQSYDPNVKLLGAVNRKAVTCFLDAVLFAMFSRLDSFEAMLYNSFDDQPRNRLGFLLRLWVNLLRSGKLITTDITKAIQDSLVQCGWEDAGELRQQDASEAFTFITEKLKLPLLTLKMDMYHSGKQDDDDHRFINERLLEVAIPKDENGQHKDVKLEDCLEDYFNNRIEVRRFLERRTTLSSMRGTESPSKGGAVHVETVEMDDSDTPLTPVSSVPSLVSNARPSNRARATSIIQERFVPDKGEKNNIALSNGHSEKKGGRVRKGSVRKEVLMPAWQFFSLIPWYTNNAPTTDAQVAAHFSSKRPILGLCLKRYSMTSSGRAVRLNTFVDVPVEIGLPHFIQDDKLDSDGSLYGNFKLSLQSVVCHRGNSVDSGHYISLVRSTPQNPNSDTDYWLRFDDLATQKITMIDIQQALREETPYLLFYQIIPVDGDPGNVVFGENPPSYADSQAHDSGISGMSGSPEFARSTTESQPPSARPSFDLPPLDDHRATIMPSESRRPSTVIISDIMSLGKSSRSTSRERDQKNQRKSASFSRSLSRGSKRLSATLANMTGTTKTKDERPLSLIPEPVVTSEDENDTPEDALAKLTGEVPAKEHHGAHLEAEAEDRGRDRKRNKSKNRLTKVYMGRPKMQKPDRECNVM